jgi:hypothetical protein
MGKLLTRNRTAATLLIALASAGVLVAADAGGIGWTAPSNWKTQPERPMRAATYEVPAAPADQEPAECAVFYFGPGQGGGVDANIRRWMGQFEGGASVTPKPSKKTIAGLPVITIEHSGTYLAGAPMSSSKTPKPGFRMIGAIVEAPGGSVFFKLTGPAKTVAAAQPAFDKMLASIKKQ